MAICWVGDAAKASHGFARIACVRRGAGCGPISIALGVSAQRSYRLSATPRRSYCGSCAMSGHSATTVLGMLIRSTMVA